MDLMPISPNHLSVGLAKGGKVSFMAKSQRFVSLADTDCRDNGPGYKRHILKGSGP